MARLDEHLIALEEQVTARGGTVHWARDANEANEIVTRLVQATGADEVVKVKSMATQEIGLNEALEAAGIAAYETDLAELIVQLGRRQARATSWCRRSTRTGPRSARSSCATMPGVDPGADRRPAAAGRWPPARTCASGSSRARVAISGANFAVAETGTLAVVESEGNGRMCLTLPQTLITVMGIEKVVPTWRDLEVFLQLLPRSSTGERMNPYTSMWTGVTPGDGPQEFHLVLLDNGRTAVLADEVGREALHCIRCSACLNVCPVYERTGGHAYGSVYPGPIGAVLSPQLTGVEDNASLPYASSACAAPATTPARWRSTSRRSWCTCGPSTSRRSTRTDPGGRRRSGRCRRPCRTRGCGGWRSGRAGLGRFLARGRPTLPDALPPPASAWTRTRDLPTPPAETFTQAVGRGSTADERPRRGARPGSGRRSADRPRRAGDRPRLPHDRRPAGRRSCSTCWSTGSRTTGRRCSAARPAEVAATVAPRWTARSAPAGRRRRRRRPGPAGRLAAGRRDRGRRPARRWRWPTSPPTRHRRARSRSPRPARSCSTARRCPGRRALSLLPDCLVCVVDAPTRSSAACPRGWPGWTRPRR